MRQLLSSRRELGDLMLDYPRRTIFRLFPFQLLLSYLSAHILLQLKFSLETYNTCKAIVRVLSRSQSTFLDWFVR